MTSQPQWKFPSCLCRGLRFSEAYTETAEFLSHNTTEKSMLSPDMEATEASVLLCATCEPLTQPEPTAAGEHAGLWTLSRTERASAATCRWPGCCCRCASCPGLCPSPCPCFHVCACACVCAYASSSSSYAHGDGGGDGGRGRLHA